MRVTTSEQQAVAARRRAFAARLLDTPAFTWTTLGTLLCAAADESAAGAGEQLACDLVGAAEALAVAAGDTGASA